jgi:hypothetical protein
LSHRYLEVFGVWLEWHLLKTKFRIFVIPAQAGIQEYRYHQASWIPACAGMTVVLGLSKCHSGLAPAANEVVSPEQASLGVELILY